MVHTGMVLWKIEPSLKMQSESRNCGFSLFRNSQSEVSSCLPQPRHLEDKLEVLEISRSSRGLGAFFALVRRPLLNRETADGWSNHKQVSPKNTV